MATPPGEAARDPFLRMHAVNVFVSDQERSLRFFLDKLGFQVAFDAQVESGERLLAVAPPDGTTVLTLIQPPANSVRARLIGRATQVVFVTENLAATYREWHSRGVRFLGAPRLRRVAYERAGAPSAPKRPASDDHATAWGGAFARFEDLDQNSFALVSFDEVSRAVEAQRQAAAVRGDARPSGAPRPTWRSRGRFGRGSFRNGFPSSHRWSTRARASRRITWAAITTTFSISAGRVCVSSLATSPAREWPRRC